MEFNTILELSKDVKNKINKYNAAEAHTKREAYNVLCDYVRNLMSSSQNRELIYRGDDFAAVFVKTLGKWRMNLFKKVLKDIEE